MSLQYILLILFIIAAVFVTALAAAAIFAGIFGKKYIYRFLKPNMRDIERDLNRLYAKHPNKSPDELAKIVIRKNALFLGLLGAVFGVGGVFFEFFGIAIDTSVSTLRQMKMAHIITAIYDNADVDPDDLEIKYMTTVLGGVGMIRLILIVIGKIIGTSIPGVGGLVGFAINYLLTISIGRAAVTWNKEETVRGRTIDKLNQLRASTTNAANNAWDRVKLNQQR